MVVIFSFLFVVLRFNIMAPLWLISGFVIVFVYFYYVGILERKYIYFPVRTFGKKLFWQSFWIRALAMFTIVFIAEITWGRPLYVGAVDSMRYFRVSREVAEVFWSQGIGQVYPHLMNEYGSADNIGVPFIIGLLFAFSINSVILANLYILTLGSFSVVFIYRTASYLLDQPTARLAGFLAAFMPLSLFFETVMLKEGFVVFFSSASIYLATKMIVTGRTSLKSIALLVLSVFSLFFFRTAAGAIIAICVAALFLLNNMKGNIFLSWTTGLGTAILFVFLLNYAADTDYYLGRIESGTEHGDARIAAVERGTSWQNLSMGPAFIVFSHFGPYPSMVRIDIRHGFGHDATYYWVAGLIVWNILALYALLGLWSLIKSKPRKSLMVWGFTVGYTIVLTTTAMFTQVRLGWNIMPMMMIPASVGLRKYPSINTFYLALAVAGFFIIAWNIFRAIGRGVL